MSPPGPLEKGPGAGMYLMMVCMPRTCGVLSRTLSVFGSGCPWWAEARAALQGGRGSELGRTRRATALGPWRDMSPPKEGSRTPRKDRHRAWPSCLDPEECPKRDTRHETPEPDYPKRPGQTSWSTHTLLLQPLQDQQLCREDIPMHPGTRLCTM